MARDGGGRERILTAAIDLFGRDGVDATTMRDIAAAAHVSPALVVHHFGSKEGLSEAADAAVMATLAANREAMERSAVAASRGEDERFAYRPLLLLVHNPHLARYVRRLIIDGGERGTAFVQALVHQAAEVQTGLIAAGAARPSNDLTTRAAVLAGMALSLVTLREPFTATLGYDPLTEEGLERWLAQVQQLVTRGFLIEK